MTGTKSSLSVQAPSFRGDIKETVDLIEEVSRIIGFDHMPTSFPQIKAENLTINNSSFKVKKLIRQALLSCGLDEAVTLSMTNQKDLFKCHQQDLKVVKVFNPLSIDQELMRPSLLPSLLKIAQINLNRGQKDLRFFEIGKRYLVQGEQDTLAILLTGGRHDDWRRNRKETTDIYDLKGTIENIFAAIGIEIALETKESQVFDVSSSCSIVLKGQEIGSFGKIKKEILNNWDIKNQDIYFAGIHLEHILSLTKPVVKYQSIVEFPAVVRDVSLAVKKEISYQSIESLCRQNGGRILRDIHFIEQYVGDKISVDQKSLVFSLVYQSNTSTLREEEVNSIHEHIVQVLTRELNATRR